MDLTLVLHSRDIAAIGLGDATDPYTVAGATTTVPSHLLPSTITLRVELFSDKCPLAAQNLSFVCNRHMVNDADLGDVVQFAKESAKYDASMSSAGANASAAPLPAALKESAVLRVEKGESIEFGTSVTDSVFGGTYLSENMTAAAAAAPVFGATAEPSPADAAGFLVVSNFGGPNTNASRYFITLRPMKEIVGNHTILGRVRAPHPSYLGGVGNGFERLLAFLRHPQCKVHAKTGVPQNKITVADSVVCSVDHLPNSKVNPNAAAAAAKGEGRTRLAGKLRGRDDDDEADILRDEFEKGIDASANNNSGLNPFANASLFDASTFGTHTDARVRTTKKRRAEAPLLSTGSLNLADKERLFKTVAVSTAQHFEGHDDAKGDSDDEGGLSSGANGAFSHHLRKKVFSAAVSAEELSATFRPVGVNPNNMAPSTFNLFEANAMTFSSDLREVMEQQIERHHNRERRMGRKQKALEKQQQARLGGLGVGGAETAASAALKMALAATAASAAQLSTAGGHGSKANKVRSAAANVSDKLGRIREKYSAMGKEHSVKAFQERARAKAAAGSAKKGRRY